jgi:citrate synthase
MAKTIIHKDNLPYFGTQPLLSIAPGRKFSDMVFELLCGEKPNGGESKLFETIMNLSIDHGTDTPSAVATINAAKERKTLSESVAAGLMQINDSHGGAIGPAMEIFYKIKHENLDIKKLVLEYLSEGKRMPGFGHRIYTVDPRSQLIFKLAKDQNISDVYINIAKEIEKELFAAKGEALPVNIDGSTAAIFCAFGWDPKLGNSVFISARVAGLCGQYLNATETK